MTDQQDDEATNAADEINTSEDDTPEDDTPEDDTPEEEAFATELARARDLLSGEGIDAVHVGIVRDGEVNTTFAQRADDPQQEGLQALALLAAHVRLVANEAGVEASTVAGDAATLAGRVEEIPASTDSLPDE